MGLFPRFPGHDQNCGDEAHGGNQEYIPAKDDQASRGGGDAYKGREVVFGTEPLLHKDRNKQGGEDEFDALEIQGQQISGSCAEKGSAHPPALVEKGDQQAITVKRQPLRGAVLGDERISLVGQGKDQIRLLLSSPLVGIYHGNAVEQVAGIDHKCGQGRGKQAGTAGEEADCHILHGAGVDKQAHGHRPKTAVAALVHDDAEAEAQKHIAGHDRDGVQKGGIYRGFFHEYHLSFWVC